MTTVDLLAWALGLMLTWTPIEHCPWKELRAETPKERTARYAEIAEAAIDVAWDEEPLFEGPQGRARTAALLLSIASYETGFYNQVTTRRGSDRKRSGGGVAWCAGQIELGRAGVSLPWHYRQVVPERWTGPELEADPRRCMVAVYRMARHSMQHCRRAPLEYRLGAYTGESCIPSAVKARNRMRRALDASLP